jgi:hypothetical protein
MWAPPPRGSHITETTLQNRQMTKNEWFQEFEGQRFLVFVFDGQNQTLTIVRWPKMDFFLFLKEPWIFMFLHAGPSTYINLHKQVLVFMF